MGRHRVEQGLGHLADDATECTVYMVSVTTELTGMHPQTLHQYDRFGLVSPARARGRSWHYFYRDVERLYRIQFLSREGINLRDIHRTLALEARMEEPEANSARMYSREAAVQWIFAAAADDEVQVVAPGRQDCGPVPRHPEAGCTRTTGTAGSASTALVPVRRQYQPTRIDTDWDWRTLMKAGRQ